VQTLKQAYKQDQSELSRPSFSETWKSFAILMGEPWPLQSWRWPPQGDLELNFWLKRCPQGLAALLFEEKKNPPDLGPQGQS
jgi:hypothetical protein